MSDDGTGGAGTRPNLWLVRHGETDWARTGRHTGLTDVPLTPAGRKAALDLARRLAGHQFAAVVSSPLIRALETARLAGFAARVQTNLDLVEWDYGADEGRTSAEIRVDRPEWTIWTQGPVRGELIEAVTARTDRVVAAARAVGGDTLCFAHGHVLRILAARWIGLPPDFGALLTLDTATISILGWDGSTPVIRRWNDGIDLD